MNIRGYIGGALGFFVGALIAQWFIRGAPPSTVLDGMALVSAFTGGLGGFLSATASKNVGPTRALVFAAGTLAGCLLVGVAIMIYRWLFL